jgi:hypothetical protein
MSPPPPEVQFVLLHHIDHWFSLKHPLFDDFWNAFDCDLALEAS